MKWMQENGQVELVRSDLTEANEDEGEAIQNKMRQRLEGPSAFTQKTM